MGFWLLLQVFDGFSVARRRSDGLVSAGREEGGGRVSAMVFPCHHGLRAHERLCEASIEAWCRAPGGVGGGSTKTGRGAEERGENGQKTVENGWKKEEKWPKRGENQVISGGFGHSALVNGAAAALRSPPAMDGIQGSQEALGRPRRSSLCPVPGAAAAQAAEPPAEGHRGRGGVP